MNTYTEFVEKAQAEFLNGLKQAQDLNVKAIASVTELIESKNGEPRRKSSRRALRSRASCSSRVKNTCSSSLSCSRKTNLFRFGIVKDPGLRRGFLL
jgi:hypothetical protein